MNNPFHMEMLQPSVSLFSAESKPNNYRQTIWQDQANQDFGLFGQTIYSNKKYFLKTRNKSHNNSNTVLIDMSDPNNLDAASSRNVTRKILIWWTR